MRSSRNSRQSHTFNERRRKRRIVVASLSATIAVAWFVAVWAFINASWFSIQTVTVYGVDASVASSVKALAEATLKGKYLGLFSRSSTLIYPHDDIARNIGTTSPLIAGATIYREGLHGLGISVTPKTSSAIICSDLPDWNGSTLLVESATNCSFADISGHVFDAAPSFSGSAYNRYYMPSFDRVAGAGPHFADLQSLYENVRRIGIEPLGMLVGDDGEYELYASNRSATSTLIIYFNDSGTISTELANLTAFWNTIDVKGSAPAYDYIDVRYAPNIFYRQSEQSAQHATSAKAKK